MEWQFIRRPEGRRLAIFAVLALLAFGCAVLVSDRLANRRAVDAERLRLANVARLTASSYQRQVDKFRLYKDHAGGYAFECTACQPDHRT
jgi:hypothetical protein